MFVEGSLSLALRRGRAVGIEWGLQLPQLRQQHQERWTEDLKAQLLEDTERWPWGVTWEIPPGLWVCFPSVSHKNISPSGHSLPAPSCTASQALIRVCAPCVMSVCSVSPFQAVPSLQGKWGQMPGKPHAAGRPECLASLSLLFSTLPSQGTRSRQMCMALPGARAR